MTPATPAKPTDQTLAALLQMRSAIRIKHHIAGRIRLKLENSGEAPKISRQEAELFEQVIARTNGILQVKTNLMARSITVVYDANAIPMQQWEAFLNATASDAPTPLEQNLRNTYTELIHAQL